jgi:integration host factor subunit beta
LTKSELIKKVSGRLPYLAKKDVQTIVNTIFQNMSDALSRGEGIEIRGFGSFRIKVRRAKDGRNPKTGETVRVPRKRIPFFKVGKELRERVNR